MTPGFSAESYYRLAGGEKMKKEKELERKGRGMSATNLLELEYGYIVLTLRAPCLFSMYVSKLYTPTQVNSINLNILLLGSVSLAASLFVSIKIQNNQNNALLYFQSSC